MFGRETNREFAQSLEIDSLARKVGDVAFDANLARDSASRAEDRASRAEDRNERALLGILQMRQKLEALQKTVAQQNAEIVRLKDEVALAKASDNARREQFKAIRPLIPADSDIISDSGQRYEDGRIKTKLRIIFEKTYDATASKLGIANPVDHRTN